MLALVVGVGVAFVKDLLAASVRVRTPDELQVTLADVPVLAWVPETARRA